MKKGWAYAGHALFVLLCVGAGVVIFFVTTVSCGYGGEHCGPIAAAYGAGMALLLVLAGYTLRFLLWYLALALNAFRVKMLVRELPPRGGMRDGKAD